MRRVLNRLVSRCARAFENWLPPLPPADSASCLTHRTRLGTTPPTPIGRSFLGLERLDDRTLPSVTPITGEVWVNNDYIFQLNPVFHQQDPAAARDGNGNSIIAYEGFRGPISFGDYVTTSVFFQRYDPTPVETGSTTPIRVDSDTYRPDPEDYLITSAYDPAVAADMDGNFVVTWTAVFANNPNDQYADDANKTVRVMARVYDGSGLPITPQTIIHEEVGNFIQGESSVGLDDAGHFVVGWTSRYYVDPNDPLTLTETDVFYKQLTWDPGLGQIVPVTGKLSPAVVTSGVQADPSVASTAAGSFVIAWEDGGSLQQPSGVYARRFQPNTSPLELPQPLASSPSAQNPSAAVSRTAGSNFGYVVAWDGTGEGFSADVFYRRVDNGTSFGLETVVNQTTTATQSDPSAAMDNAGNIVIAWQSGTGGMVPNVDWEVYARRFLAGGTPDTGEFRVNVSTPDGEYEAAVAIGGGRGQQFVVAWTRQYNQEMTDDPTNVFARFYRTGPKGGGFLMGGLSVAAPWQPEAILVGQSALSGEVAMTSRPADRDPWAVIAEPIEVHPALSPTGGDHEESVVGPEPLGWLVPTDERFQPTQRFDADW